jgi:hypothetical protein
VDHGLVLQDASLSPSSLQAYYDVDRGKVSDVDNVRSTFGVFLCLSSNFVVHSPSYF